MIFIFVRSQTPRNNSQSSRRILKCPQIVHQAMKNVFKCAAGLAAIFGLTALTCNAWDYEGHRLVNQIALASLPSDFPAFVLTPEAKERIAFLAGEPDRWRNTSDPTFAHVNGTDHYLDLEQLDDY